MDETSYLKKNSSNDYSDKLSRLSHFETHNLGDNTVLKVCKSCFRTKPLADFHKNRNKKDGRDGRCKECVSEAKAKTYKKNKKKLKERVKFTSSVAGILSEIHGQEFARIIGSAIKNYLPDESGK